MDSNDFDLKYFKRFLKIPADSKIPHMIPCDSVVGQRDSESVSDPLLNPICIQFFDQSTVRYSIKSLLKISKRITSVPIPLSRAEVKSSHSRLSMLNQEIKYPCIAAACI